MEELKKIIEIKEKLKIENNKMNSYGYQYNTKKALKRVFFGNAILSILLFIFNIGILTENKFIVTLFVLISTPFLIYSTFILAERILSLYFKVINEFLLNIYFMISLLFGLKILVELLKYEKIAGDGNLNPDLLLYTLPFVIMSLIIYIFRENKDIDLEKEKSRKIINLLENEEIKIKNIILKSENNMIKLTEKTLLNKSNKMERLLIEELTEDYKLNYFKEKSLNMILKERTTTIETD